MVRRGPASQLTVRDRDILYWVGSGGIASLEQLARRFWPAKRIVTAHDRLRQLVKSGYLEMHVCDARSPGERVFSLTQAGAQQLAPELQRHLYIGLPSIAELRQQLLAQEAYLKLDAQAREQGGQLVDWQSERQLRAEVLRTQRLLKHSGQPVFQAEIPDARAVIAFPHKQHEVLYIEMDGAYYGKILCQKAISFAASGQKVIWVCTEARVKYVQEAVANYPNIEALCV